MIGERPTWAVLARLAGGMKAQADERRHDYLWNRGKVSLDEERALRDVFIAWDDAAHRVHLEAVQAWWGDSERIPRAARRWMR